MRLTDYFLRVNWDICLKGSFVGPTPGARVVLEGQLLQTDPEKGPLRALDSDSDISQMAEWSLQER